MGTQEIALLSIEKLQEHSQYQTKNYVLVVTLSTQDNANILQQLKSGFKRTVNYIEYQSKVTNERQNQSLYYLIIPSFQGINRLFVLSFEDKIRAEETGYFQCCDGYKKIISINQ